MGDVGIIDVIGEFVGIIRSLTDSVDSAVFDVDIGIIELTFLFTDGLGELVGDEDTTDIFCSCLSSIYIPELVSEDVETMFGTDVLDESIPVCSYKYSIHH